MKWITHQASEICRPETLGAVLAELERATQKFGPFHSAHEAASVLREEYEELWDEVKRRDRSKTKMRNEAIQVAAMALMFIENICQ